MYCTYRAGGETMHNSLINMTQILKLRSSTVQNNESYKTLGYYFIHNNIQIN